MPVRARLAPEEMRRQVRDTELALHRGQPLIERGRELGSSNSGAIDEVIQVSILACALWTLL